MRPAAPLLTGVMLGVVLAASARADTYLEVSASVIGRGNLVSDYTYKIWVGEQAARIDDSVASSHILRRDRKIYARIDHRARRLTEVPWEAGDLRLRGRMACDWQLEGEVGTEKVSGWDCQVRSYTCSINPMEQLARMQRPRAPRGPAPGRPRPPAAVEAEQAPQTAPGAASQSQTAEPIPAQTQPTPQEEAKESAPDQAPPRSAGRPATVTRPEPAPGSTRLSRAFEQQIKVWTSDKVPAQWDALVSFLERAPPWDQAIGALRELPQAHGFPVRFERHGVTFDNVLTLLKVEQRDVPPEHYEPPQGYELFKEQAPQPGPQRLRRPAVPDHDPGS